MVDFVEVFKGILCLFGVIYSVLMFNDKGMQVVFEFGVDEVVIFVVVLEVFFMCNINCSIVESFKCFEMVM